MGSTSAPPVAILTSQDPGWDESRQAYNFAVDQEPAAVARLTTACGVEVAFRHAIDQGLRVAAQSTGHNARPLGPLGDTLLLHTDALSAVAVNPGTCTARVGAGARWRSVQTETDRHGLVALAGSAPTLGAPGTPSAAGSAGWGARTACVRTPSPLSTW